MKVEMKKRLKIDIKVIWKVANIGGIRMEGLFLSYKKQCIRGYNEGVKGEREREG